MDDKRVRISDIAEELGLSTATVSNVLHGKTKKVSDRTVQRVQALLEKRTKKRKNTAGGYRYLSFLLETVYGYAFANFSL